jgi:hypothetical protein
VAGRALGTPAYMAPEQARGESLDARADVYALGAILYHLLAGRMPYADSAASTGPELLRHVVSEPPTPLLEIEPKVPRDLAAIVDRAMARDPAQRYADAKQLAADLRRFETGQLVSVRAYSAAELFRRWLRRNRVVVAFALLLLVLAAVGGTISVTRIVDERDRARAAEEEAVTAKVNAVEAQRGAEKALRDKEQAEAASKQADQRAAEAGTAALEATTRATQSMEQAKLTSASLLALWLEAKLALELQDCYMAHYLRGATRLPSTLTLEIDDKRKPAAIGLAGSPAPLSACIGKAVRRSWDPPALTAPGSYSFPIDIDPQTGEPKVGVWVSDVSWHVEVVRRRYSVTFTRCYQKRLIEGLSDKRSTTASFVIQATGRVALKANKVGPVDDPMLAACLAGEVDRWQLAALPAAVPVSLNVLERKPPAQPATEVCPFGHTLFDEDGTLVADRRMHACTAYGRFDGRDGRRNKLDWHSHDPAVGNAR